MPTKNLTRKISNQVGVWNIYIKRHIPSLMLLYQCCEIETSEPFRRPLLSGSIQKINSTNKKDTQENNKIKIVYPIITECVQFVYISIQYENIILRCYQETIAHNLMGNCSFHKDPFLLLFFRSI